MPQSPKLHFYKIIFYWMKTSELKVTFINYYILSIYRSHIPHNNAHNPTVTRVKLLSDFQTWMTPHTLPLRVSYGVSFMSFSKKSNRDISRAHCISRVSCQKGPTHAYAWQIGPFWQDTLDINTFLIHSNDLCWPAVPVSGQSSSPTMGQPTCSQCTPDNCQK